jgi:hypothetical protein
LRTRRTTAGFHNVVAAAIGTGNFLITGHTKYYT